MSKVRFGPITVALSNTGKVLFPGEHITKGDLIEYYRKVAAVMLPHVEGRPISMHRFPDGIAAKGFYQKEASDYFPRWIRTVKVKKRGGRVNHVVISNEATLVFLANQACVTPHPWLSRADKLNYPDRMVFDLDPPNADFKPVARAARHMKKLLSEIGLDSLIMTTGSRGLHVVVPLDRKANFDAVRIFARDASRVLARRRPKELTTEVRKNKRKGRIYLDSGRNAYAQTAVAPYSVRPRPGAPVATPLDWSEISDRRMHSQRYNLRNLFRRLSRREDPWKKIERRAQSLTKPRRSLNTLLRETTGRG